MHTPKSVSRLRSHVCGPVIYSPSTQAYTEPAEARQAPLSLALAELVRIEHTPTHVISFPTLYASPSAHPCKSCQVSLPGITAWFVTKKRACINTSQR